MILNEQQSQAVSDIIDFIDNGDPNTFYLLQGKAGTGKTTIIGHVLRQFRNLPSVAITLSHKAKHVIRQALRKAGDTGTECTTIASFLQMEFNYETGRFVASKSPGGQNLLNSKIIVVDEASMVNEEALELIMVNKHEHCKVIMLGDIGQLPPIRTKENPYYMGRFHLIGNKSPVFLSAQRSILTERVRQGEESPILPFADLFWHNSQSDNVVRQPASDRTNIITSKGALVFVPAISEIMSDIIDMFKIAVQDFQPNMCKVVCYRNIIRKQINTIVHEALFGDKLYGKGEILIFNDSWNGEFDADKFSFENSEEVQVIESYESRETITLAFGSYTKSLTKEEFEEELAMQKKRKDANPFNREPEIKRYQERELVKKFEYRYHVIKVMTSDNVEKLVKVVHADSQREWETDVAACFTFASNGANDRKKAYKAAYQLKRSYANLDYGYAITAHRSQGSTYQVVVVNESDIMSVAPTTNREKSEAMYTAITRAKHMCVVVSDISVPSLDENIMDVYKKLSTSVEV